MLFEKIQFMNEDALKKREQDVTRKTNEDLLQNKESLKFE